MLSSCENVVSANVPNQLDKISKRIVELQLHEEFIKVQSQEGVDWLSKHCADVKRMFDHFMDINGHRGLIEVSFIILTRFNYLKFSISLV